MKQLYFIRHGLSELNVAGKFAGKTDTPLVDEGHEQAKKAGKLAKEAGLKIDIIVSSPLSRAHSTAKHVANHLEYPEENIILDSRFEERHYGELEGKNVKSIAGTKYGINEAAIDKYEGVESLKDLQKRADEALEYLESLEYENILVVAHGAFGRALYRSVKKLPMHERNMRFNNAEMVQFI